MTNLKIETIKKNDFFFDKSYQEYQSDYYKTNFTFKEIIIKDCKEEYHIPFTLHNKNSTKYISFLGEPLKMYLDDILTTSVNLAGNCAISIPCGFQNGLPIGLQIIGNHFNEELILNVANKFEKLTEFNKQNTSF